MGVGVGVGINVGTTVGSAVAVGVGTGVPTGSVGPTHPANITDKIRIAKINLIFIIPSPE